MIFWTDTQTAKDRACDCIQQTPSGYYVTVTPRKRSLSQNAQFHRICQELAKSDIKIGGKTRDLNEWKTLLVSAHAVVTKSEFEVLPEGLEGEPVILRESTSTMSKSRSSSLIEYAICYAAMHGIY